MSGHPLAVLREVQAAPPVSPSREAWQRLLNNRGARVSLVLALAIVVVALAQPWITSRPYDAQRLDLAYRKPLSAAGVLGTDALGRDLWSRLVFGVRLSLVVALVSQVAQLLIGVPIGLVAGYFGGRVDAVLMRIVDTMLAFPALLLALVIAVNIKVTAAEGSGWFASFTRWANDTTSGLAPVFIVVVVFFWLFTARLVRGASLKIAQQDYVRAAQAIGVPHWRIIARHVLPNVTGPIVVGGALAVPAAIIVEASLSFFGLGVDPPVPSLGLLIFDGAEAINAFPYLLLVPATALGVVTIVFTFLADGLRDAFDPTTRHTR